MGDWIIQKNLPKDYQYIYIMKIIDNKGYYTCEFLDGDIDTYDYQDIELGMIGNCQYLQPSRLLTDEEKIELL